MTWKRVATALVLIPVVVGLVLFTPTWVVAIATAAITVLALWEYFALGDAIGHRAYRLWTVFCSLLLVYVHWRVLRPFSYLSLSVSTTATMGHPPVPVPPPTWISAVHSSGSIFFLF